LGFNDNNKLISHKVKLLSGGNQTKLVLCKALLLEPELLLLDEPSNNLSIKNIAWLEEYLCGYKKSLIFITHNISFFDTVANKLIYFFTVNHESPQVYQCNGGYTNFLKVYGQKRTEYVSAYEKFNKKISELKKKNTPENKTKIEELIKNNKIVRPSREHETKIKFNDINILSSDEYKNVISLDDVCFGYTETNIIENITLGISTKSRYVLIGENGAGKTTFFNICSKNLQPTSGDIIFDNRIRIGYFNQHSVTEIRQDITPIQYLQSIDSNLSQQECRAILAQIGFKKMYDDDKFDVGKLLISELSGGQKVKVVLCGIRIQNPHVILFDEITNHLSIESIDEFIETINAWNGGVLIITHDAYVIEKIENYELLILQNKHLYKFGGTFEQYCKAIENVDTE
jgi:ATP-binding cassette subfamily F protein 1